MKIWPSLGLAALGMGIITPTYCNEPWLRSSPMTLVAKTIPTWLWWKINTFVSKGRIRFEWPAAATRAVRFCWTAVQWWAYWVMVLLLVPTARPSLLGPLIINGGSPNPCVTCLTTIRPVRSLAICKYYSIQDEEMENLLHTEFFVWKYFEKFMRGMLGGLRAILTAFEPANACMKPKLESRRALFINDDRKPVQSSRWATVFQGRCKLCEMPLSSRIMHGNKSKLKCSAIKSGEMRFHTKRRL